MDVERIKLAGKEIILVGTAHVSAESVEQVRKAIAQEKPDVVGVELCAQRLAQLKSGEKWKEQNIAEIVKSGQTYLFLVNLLLANMQRRIGQELGIRPGEEMLKAVEAAEKSGAGVELLDRDVRTTMKRAFARMGLIEKLKLAYSLISSLIWEREHLTAENIEELKKKDVMTQLMEELGRELPSVKQVLVDERNAYIANKIAAARGKKIVAVVGAGHVDGIKSLLQGAPVGIEGLEVLPKKNKWVGLLKYAVPLAIVALLGYLLLTKGWESSLYALLLWALINGACAALGVVVAGGSIYAMATAFLTSPFAALHPLVAVGWFAGLAQARVSMPKVKDFEGLRELNSYRDFTRNPVTKILLVAAFANVGSMIGTLVAFPTILALLA